MVRNPPLQGEAAQGGPDGPFRSRRYRQATRPRHFAQLSIRLITDVAAMFRMSVICVVNDGTCAAALLVWDTGRSNRITWRRPACRLWGRTRRTTPVPP